MRIVSLLPSATELLAALGLEDQLVGITHGCDYPETVQTRPRVTGTEIPKEGSSREIDRLVRERHAAGLPLYALDEDLLAKLAPDLLVTQGLCDVCAVPDSDATAMAGRLPGRPRVVSLAPTTLEDVLANVLELGDVTGTGARARELVSQFRARIDAVRLRAASLPPPRVSLLEWLDPPYAAGHWTPELVALAGGVEGHGRPGGRSRAMGWEEVVGWQPEVVLVACCGFTVERALEELDRTSLPARLAELPAGQTGRVYVTDGQGYFSRPSLRLADSLELLAHLFHPDHFAAQGAPCIPVEIASRR
jgi:iron complex transport system substrate-binding protein